MIPLSLFVLLFTVLFAGFVDNVQGTIRCITGGKLVPSGACPFMVSIQKWYRDHWGHICGGSILNPNWILTACHCVAYTSPWKYRNAAEHRVIAGVNNYNSKLTTRQEALVEKYVAHPKCNRRGKPLFTFYDAGLIKLQSPLEYNSRVQPLKLFSTQPDVAANELNHLQKKHAYCVTPGWGLIEEVPRKKRSPYLRYANHSLNTAAECQDVYCLKKSPYHEEECGDFDELGQLCVTTRVGTISAGDSGGPLVCNGFVFGVVSQTGSGRVWNKQIFTGIATILTLVNEHVPNDDVAPDVARAKT